MSKLKQVIILSPPQSYNQEHVETIQSTAFDCPGCGGNGWRGWSLNPDTNEEGKRICTVCLGAKKVKATVTINWEPVKPNNNE